MKNPYNTIREVNNYVKERGVLMSNGHVLLMEPLLVFKKILTYDRTEDPVYRGRKMNRDYEWLGYHNWYTRAIASMIIPVGSKVNLAQDSELKFRADKAFCYSISRIHNSKDVVAGRSSRRSGFRYLSAKAQGVTEGQALEMGRKWKNHNRDKDLSKFMVYPEYSFDERTTTCASGVHFFIHSREAVNYL